VGNLNPLDLYNVRDQLSVIQRRNHRAERHLDHDIFTLGAGAIVTLTIGAAFGDKASRMAEIRQRIQILGTDDVYRTAIAAVAAIGTAHRNVFFATETDDAVTAIAGFDENVGFIDKFHRRIIPIKKPRVAGLC